MFSRPVRASLLPVRLNAAAAGPCATTVTKKHVLRLSVGRGSNRQMRTRGRGTGVLKSPLMVLMEGAGRSTWWRLREETPSVVGGSADVRGHPVN